jgi:hypothetical protein
VVLTEKGRETQRQLWDLTAPFRSALCQAVPEEQLASTLEVLARVARVMTVSQPVPPTESAEPETLATAQKGPSATSDSRKR